MADFNVNMDWSGDADADARPVNTVQVQELGTELIVYFGHATPPIPIAAMDEEQAKEFFAGNSIKVRQVTRHVLTAHAAAILVSSLQSNNRVREIIKRATDMREVQAEGSDE